MRRRRPRRCVQRLRWRVEFLLARAAMGVVGLLPEGLALRLGAGLGRLAARALPRRRQQVEVNLRLAFPDWDEGKRRCFVGDNLAELGRCAAEWARLPGLSREALLQRVEFVGVEHFERALAKGNGVLAVTAHYGSWELLPAAMRARMPEAELHVVGRKLRNPFLYRRIVRRRTLGGGEVLPQDARAILRALRRGAAIGILADQYAPQRRGGVLAPFFGLRAWTTAGPATLSLRTGAPLLPVCVRRLQGSRHRVEFFPALEIEPRADRAQAIAEGTARMNAALESFIRAHPEPWLWSHRRFRRSPDLGVVDPYEPAP